MEETLGSQIVDRVQTLFWKDRRLTVWRAAEDVLDNGFSVNQLRALHGELRVAGHIDRNRKPSGDIDALKASLVEAIGRQLRTDVRLRQADTSRSLRPRRRR